MEELHKKIAFIGGKGGVGKSTSAAALAWKRAKEGRKTLLVSTDPAHNLGDIFEENIGGRIKKVSSHLDVLEIDPEQETTAYINSVKENMKGIVQPSMINEVNRQLDTAKASPGADEAALFNKLISIIIEEHQHYDQCIIDTAPTGHTIRLLTLPELMGIWIDGLLQRRKKTNENYTQLLNDGEPIEDPIYHVLEGRKGRFAKARELLLDDERTGFIFVVNPESLSITETDKAIRLLHQHEIYVKNIIVNKLLPEQVDGNFFAKRKQMEQTYVQKIEAIFKEQKKWYVPLFHHDIMDKRQLETFSAFF
ncbi:MULTISPECIES: ArsA family ATPase [Virgibacillus]|uniref:ArsA family ATPase n=1 Tax=Virgibacillus dokdonensis TaxID=302167 RepID=A0A2K9J6H0_9BACI|nr:MULTISPECIES: ArsA family ATPase [Virgibacillus]AUJ26873.1 Arsenical pump-driving ATPase [Virgibacillus dokdonensis]NWO14930.1 ArsA family ATPase [Virgibacillus sp.]